MIRAGGYLHALVTAMIDTPMGLAPEKWAGYVESTVDATVISRPGSVNGDARIQRTFDVGHRCRPGRFAFPLTAGTLGSSAGSRR
jgi:hypothetical protein